MKTKLFLISLLFTTFISFAQSEQCGTMKIFEEKIKSDASFKEKMLQIEKQNQEWIEKNGMGFKKHTDLESNKKSINTAKSALNTNILCNYDNVFYREITAPVILNSIVSPIQNCTYGGEYVRVTNLIAGRTYRISTCGLNNFDTQITIYPSGGGNSVAFNDDWCGSQSEIYFTPIFSGNYDILIDEYGCVSNSSCASLEVELWYIPRPVITIPVVVHVIHQGEQVGTGTNISNAQIQSQIDVLNEDFRRQNLNILNVPSPFRGASADPLIQFCLAQQDPNGTITNGITRHLRPTQEEYTQLGVPTELQCLNRITVENIIKPFTIWNRDKYLNLWVSDLRQLPPSVGGNPAPLGCNFQAGILGYAQFPGEPVSANYPNPELTDGVWIRYDVFGRIGNLFQSYNLGRTTTHEVGHWLNLKHTWGDDTTAQPSLPECSLDDDVSDTPIQSNPSYGCLAFPYTDGCSQYYPGIMFQNYMDYSNDNCLGMYTYGQSARMDAALFNQRVSLLASPGCIPGSLSSIEFNDFKVPVFPNPTTSAVFFDNAKLGFTEVQVFNYLGQEVAREQLTGADANQEINLSTLSAGVYVLKFHNGTSTATAKVVKQ